MGRIICVGDRNQAIYGFRGAHASSMDELKDRFHCRELPLSISYRCPRAVVEKAREWVPQIEASENAQDGFVGEEETDWKGQAQMALGSPDCCMDCGRGYFAHVQHPIDPDLAKGQGLESHSYRPAEHGISKWTGLRDFLPGDAILCRLTRPLVALAFILLRERIPCRVLGRDIGQGLANLIQRVVRKGRLSLQDDLSAFDTSLDDYFAVQRAKLLSKGKHAEIGRLEDQVATIRIFMLGGQEGVGGRDGDSISGTDAASVAVAEVETVAQLISDVERMFEDNGKTRMGVVLSTCHKAKGLEWTRVFILDASELMPWRWARQDWELQGERNLMYVAATRAKRELRYVTSKELGVV